MDSTTLDRFGRVLLPKEVRDRLGIGPGDELRIEVEEHGVTLHPVKASASWEMRGGLPVWTGPVPEEALDIVAFIHHQREERIQRIARRSMGN